MECSAAQDRLSLLADDDLPAEEVLAVRSHLAECRQCARAHQDIDRLSRELRLLPQPPVPADLRSRIGRALDREAPAVAATRESGRSVLATVAPYLAAAAVIALAFGLVSFLAPPRHQASRVAKSAVPLTESTRASAARESTEGPAATPAEDKASEPAPNSATDEADAVRKAVAAIEKLQKDRQLRERDDELLRGLPPALDGTPGGGIVTIRPYGEAGAPGAGSKPPRTFGGRDEPVPPAPPAEPTIIDIRFLPPDSPAVGSAAQGVVEVSSREAIPEVLVTATGDEGLAIDKPGGVLYRGPLQAGEAVRVPLPMVASKSGSHEVSIDVESDAPGGDTQLKVFVPSFKSAPPARPETSPGDKPVSMVFKNTPIRQALMDIARQAALRIEIPEGLGTERISRDIRNVPAKAAVQAIAESGGYTVTEADGVFKVGRKSAGNSD